MEGSGPLRIGNCLLRVFELRASREGAKGKGREEKSGFDSDPDTDSRIFDLDRILMQAGSPHHNRSAFTGDYGGQGSRLRIFTLGLRDSAW